MQNGNSKDSHKAISLSELSFADIAKMRREKQEKSEKKPAIQSGKEQAKEQPAEEPHEGPAIELRDDIELEADYYKVPNGMQKIAPLQDPKEYCAYTYLYRLSYGWRRNFCRAGYGTLVKNTSLSSRSSAIRAIEGLLEKRHIIRIEEDTQKRAGSLYRVLTPEEILSGIFNMSIVRLNIVKMSTVGKGLTQKNLQLYPI